MNFLSFLGVLVSGIGLAQAAEKVQAPPAPVVLVQPARRSDLFEVLTYPARVAPKINANVLAESEGVVAQIRTPLGTRVARGKPLLVLKHTDPVYQYAPVVITAPVSGVVSAVEVTEGTLVTKGQRLATVTDPSRVRITVEVAAVDLSKISAGLESELKVPGQTLAVKVRVQGVSPYVDPATGTALCELAVLPGEPALAPGIVGQVNFKVNQHLGFTLPEHAIVYKGLETFVRIVDKGKAKYLSVKLGAKSRGNVEVATGLNEGMTVIERANGYVGEGEAVTVQEKSI